MFVKTTARKTKSGTVRYLHLAHSEWDPVAGRSVPKILYGFGREDQLDRDAIKRLVGSLTRLLDPADAQAASASAGSELAFCESRPFGGTFVLDALWRRLGIDTVLRGLDTGPGRTPRRGRPRAAEVTERVLFGLVANRALAPSSKLAAADWINHDVHIDGLPETSDDACYRAMDWLHDVTQQRGARQPRQHHREPARRIAHGRLCAGPDRAARQRTGPDRQRRLAPRRRARPACGRRTGPPGARLAARRGRGGLRPLPQAHSPHGGGASATVLGQQRRRPVPATMCPERAETSLAEPRHATTRNSADGAQAVGTVASGAVDWRRKSNRRSGLFMSRVRKGGG